jgi:hypothetical protein
MDPWQYDQICRMCKQSPHTDPHILLECSANTAVIDLRRTHLAHVEIRDQSDRTLHGCFNDLMARRDATRIPILMLVAGINEIYEDLPRCSELVWADQVNPGSVLFITTEIEMSDE